MSHFTVLVIGDNVDEQMAPYHEFECTGEDNQYVQDIDITKDARAEFKKDTTTVYQTASGKLQRRFTKNGNWDLRYFRKVNDVELAEINGQDVFSRDHGDLKDGRAYFTRYSKDYKNNTIYVQRIPQGWKEVEAPTSKVESFAQWAEGYYGVKPVGFGKAPNKAKTHKYGYILLDKDGKVKKIVDRTNPNKKWDGYQIGGRWNGFFKLKPAAVGAALVGVGAPGLQGYDSGYVAPGPDRADVCQKGQVDIAGMRDDAGAEAAKRYDLFSSATAGLPAFVSWNTILLEHGIDTEADKPDYTNIEAARSAFHAQPVVQALRSNEATRWYDAEDFQMTKAEYVQSARDGALSTYALLHEGVWYSKGRMGWFGMSLDETMTQAQWNAETAKLIDSLPDETMLTVVDCHI
jgi:hypothetical protein